MRIYIKETYTYPYIVFIRRFVFIEFVRWITDRMGRDVKEEKVGNRFSWR